MAIERRIPWEEMDDDQAFESGQTFDLSSEVDDDELPDEMVIDLDGPSDGVSRAEDIEFSGNFAAALTETQRQVLSSGLRLEYDADLSSRDVWEQRYETGIKLLGITTEKKTEPWDGCSGVYHPLLMETAIAYQSNAIQEICPSTGPADVKILGQETQEKLERAARVKAEFNYQIMTKMPEWRPEMDRLLWSQSLMGSAFKKVYLDPILGRQTSRFVPATDFVIQYGASDLQTCPRYTHRERVFRHTIEKLQDIGFYLDDDLGDPHIEQDEIEEAENKETGVERDYVVDDRYMILEMHVERTIEQIENKNRPYIITLEYYTGKILSIRRNWREDDPFALKRIHFVHYPYIPGFGFYALGLIHIIGGAVEAATALLRQLIDAGTIINTPSGFKSKTVRIKGEETPLAPGEFRDVDILTGKLADGLMFLPAKPPSEVSLALLQNIVEEARRTASMAEMKLTDSSSGTPVGTTLALLERSLRVMSAVHSRLHFSTAQELGLLQGIFAKDMPEQYDYDQELGFNRQQDFGAPIALVPVSDPNAATQSQRIIQIQTATAFAAQSPEVFDKPLLYQKAMRAIGLPDAEKIVPIQSELLPTDPVSENMNILTGKPVRAHIEEDHEAHLRVHMAALNDPQIMAMVGQAPNAAIIQGAAYAHIQEHIAYKYRSDLEKKLGVPLPPPNENLPPDLAANVANVAADAAERLLETSMIEQANKAAMAAATDPAMEIERGKVKNAADANQIKLILGKGDQDIKREGIAADLIKHGIDKDVDLEMHGDVQQQETNRLAHEEVKHADTTDLKKEEVAVKKIAVNKPKQAPKPKAKK